MTEYEIRDLMFGYFSTMNDQAAMYFTLVSAYLITSYLVGAKLTTRQISIINMLYVLWVLGTINAMYSMLTGLSEMFVQLETASNVELDFKNRSSASVLGFLFVQVAGLLASLYFMWHVRRPKSE